MEKLVKDLFVNKPSTHAHDLSETEIMLVVKAISNLEHRFVDDHYKRYIIQNFLLGWASVEDALYFVDLKSQEQEQEQAQEKEEKPKPIWVVLIRSNGSNSIQDLTTFANKDDAYNYAKSINLRETEDFWMDCDVYAQVVQTVTHELYN